ncbi:unnamed protein product [Didymodactylos carnosus]|uniref:ABC transmembrane type-1 domain-containing protein n=1 Tax=Didymodactylos carnosus TaxID=1234261 RepID=A0A8S2S7S3_9BILA|nr:unnamed protein product [Didymodactylos carnosus]CAF4210305.1 unnamed protein product [Didymodactylos carnosus]
MAFRLFTSCCRNGNSSLFLYTTKYIFSPSPSSHLLALRKCVYSSLIKPQKSVPKNLLSLLRKFSLSHINRRRPNSLLLSEKKKPTTKASFSDLKRLLRLAVNEKGRILFAIVLLCISSGVTMCVPYFLGKIIDMLQTYKGSELKRRLKQISFALVCIFLIGAICNYGRIYLILSTSQRIIKRLREQLFESILRKEMAFFDKNKTGELVNRLSSDTEVMANSITQNISDGLRATTQAIAGVGLMFYISPQLAFVGMSTIPPVALGAIMFGRYVKRISTKVQTALAHATDVAEERFANIRTVKAFSQEMKEIRLYNKKIGDVLELKFKESLAYALFYGMTGLSGNCIVLTVGVSISGLFSFHLELMRGIGASQAVWGLLTEENSELIQPITTAPTFMRDLFLKDILFDNITFAYPTRPDVKVIENLTLKVPGGKILAIVGSSGSGKSTLSQLLLRFYKPQEGNIFIGETNIQDISLDFLRQNIGSVPQEPVLFSSSIRDNIAYGIEQTDSIPIDQNKLI